MMMTMMTGRKRRLDLTTAFTATSSQSPSQWQPFTAPTTTAEITTTRRRNTNRPSNGSNYYCFSTTVMTYYMVVVLVLSCCLPHHPQAFAPLRSSSSSRVWHNSDSLQSTLMRRTTTCTSPFRINDNNNNNPFHSKHKHAHCSTSLLRMGTSNTDNDSNNIDTSTTAVIPKHVAFICDGNSRWAKQRHLPTSVGHVVGADRLVDLLEQLEIDGIEYCTLYGFSTENWKRSPSEIRDIFRVMEETARKVWKRVQASPNVRIRLLGDLEDERIPFGLRNILRQLQKMTEENSKKEKNDTTKTLTVCLAVNYGGRQDIVAASQKMAQAVANGDLSPEDVTEDTLSGYLSTAGIPDPDMIVRTSGEYRLSNFLLWNCAYSEIYITPTLWPDFDHDSWKDALNWYRQRQRRFGSRSDEKEEDEEEKQQQQQQAKQPIQEQHRQHQATVSTTATLPTK